MDNSWIKNCTGSRQRPSDPTTFENSIRIPIEKKSLELSELLCLQTLNQIRGVAPKMKLFRKIDTGTNQQYASQTLFSSPIPFWRNRCSQCIRIAEHTVPQRRQREDQTALNYAGRSMHIPELLNLVDSLSVLSCFAVVVSHSTKLFYIQK